MAYLKNVDNLFPDNNIFSVASDQLDAGKTVAIKVSKQNAFNDRDGIQFYALRELMILQHLQSCKSVVRLIDSFVQEGQVCIVMEHLP